MNPDNDRHPHHMKISRILPPGLSRLGRAATGRQERESVTMSPTASVQGAAPESGHTWRAFWQRPRGRDMPRQTTLEGTAPVTGGTARCLLCRVDDTSANQVLMDSDHFYVRYDNFPASDGHVEVVPKRHVVSFFDLSPSEMAEAYRLMRDAQKTLSKQYDPQGYTIGINEGRAAGRSVDHLHIHLIPRYEGDVADPSGGIRQILPNCNPAEWGALT
jgi:diadenosine tetraphosphate (Ap4A) HIT family hydrolase